MISLLLLAQIGLATPPSLLAYHRLQSIPEPRVNSVVDPIALRPRGLAADTVPRTLAGRVVEYGTGTPLGAVHIDVLGTRLGAFTDGEGRFQVEVPDTTAITVRASTVGKCTWERTFRLDEDVRPIEVSLYAKPFVSDGPPSVGIPEFAYGVELPVSVEQLRCAYEQSEVDAGRSTLDLSQRSEVFTDLRGVLLAALRTEDIQALANSERGDEPVVVPVDDPSIAEHPWVDAPFPVQFKRPKEALRSLYVGDATILLNITLRDIATNRVSLLVRFRSAEVLKGDAWRPEASRIVDVVRTGDHWSGEVHQKDVGRRRPN
jgi:hypothetical protein